MKTIIRTILALALLALASHASMQRWDLPAQKTGTGAHDFYSLGAIVGDDPAKYYICVASSKKIDLSDVTATLEGEAIAIGEKQTTKALLGKADTVMVYPTRAQMMKGVIYGMQIKLVSKRGGMEFSIPDKQVIAILGAADKDDRHKQRSEVDALAKDFDPAVAAKYSAAGSGKITGQAFLKTRGGNVRLGAGNSIMLMPDDAWTRRAVALMKTDPGANKLPSEIATYLARTIRTEQADAQGNFEFGDLPAGLYRLHTLILWEVPTGYRYGMETTGGEVETVALVKDGATARVMLTR